MTPRIITDATDEPISYNDIVAHSKIPFGQQKSLVESYIRSARESCENYINGTISPKTLEIALQSFTERWSTRGWRCLVELPLGPVQTIVFIKYIDADGVEQTLDHAGYALDLYSRPRALRLAYGATWPSTRSQFDAVKIRYTVGYGFNDSPPVAVPEPILQAIRLQVDHMIETRTAVDVNTLAELPLGIKYLLDPYRNELGV